MGRCRGRRWCLHPMRHLLGALGLWPEHVQLTQEGPVTLRLAFWIIMLILIVFSGLGVYGLQYTHYANIGSGFVVLVLFFIVGWQIFGPPIQKG